MVDAELEDGLVSDLGDVGPVLTPVVINKVGEILLAGTRGEEYIVAEVDVRDAPENVVGDRVLVDVGLKCGEGGYVKEATKLLLREDVGGEVEVHFGGERFAEDPVEDLRALVRREREKADHLRELFGTQFREEHIVGGECGDVLDGEILAVFLEEDFEGEGDFLLGGDDGSDLLFLVILLGVVIEGRGLVLDLEELL